MRLCCWRVDPDNFEGTGRLFVLMDQKISFSPMCSPPISPLQYGCAARAATTSQPLMEIRYGSLT